MLAPLRRTLPLLAVCLGAALAAAAPAAAAPELAVNGSFETGPDGTTFYGGNYYEFTAGAESGATGDYQYTVNQDQSYAWQYTFVAADGTKRTGSGSDDGAGASTWTQRKESADGTTWTRWRSATARPTACRRTRSSR